MDTQFIIPPDFVPFGVETRTHHQQQFVNVLYSDGHAVSLSNADGRYSVALNDFPSLMNAFSIILGAMEKADTAQ